MPIDRKIYPTNDKMFDDLGQAYAKAVRAFADAGCRYLQLDEVFIAMLCDDKYRQQMRDRGDDPDKLGMLYGDLINTAMSDIPADMTITMHLCRGNYRSTWQGQGGYEKVQEILFNRINVHGYFMEYDSERAGGFEPLKLLPKDKKVVLGLVTTKTGQLESKDAIKRRIEEAAKFTDISNSVPVRPVRLRLDRGRQHARRGRAVGEAAHDRRSGERGVGRCLSTLPPLPVLRGERRRGAEGRVNERRSSAGMISDVADLVRFVPAGSSARGRPSRLPSPRSQVNEAEREGRT